jgi:transposase-like protein
MGVDRTKLPLGCTRHSYNLEVKKVIVDEAFALPKNLHATARKFSIQPTQICTWKKKFDSVAVTSSDTTTTGNDNTDKPSPKRFKKCTESRFGGGGRKPLLNDGVIKSLKQFYNGKREEDIGVTLRLMMTECRLLDQSACTLSAKALEGRVYRLLVKWDASWRRGTHKVQNTRHDIVVMNDFRLYVRLKASILGVNCRVVSNADETNVFYSMEGKYTYAKRGSRTVGIKGAAAVGRCTVMFGTNLAGDIKLPLMVIYSVLTDEQEESEGR